MLKAYTEYGGKVHLVFISLTKGQHKTEELIVEARSRFYNDNCHCTVHSRVGYIIYAHNFNQNYDMFETAKLNLS